MPPIAEVPSSLATAMASGFDRLEKLFSKKKHASTQAAPQHQHTLYRSASVIGQDAYLEPSPPLFPQPSFIRPKMSKMVARQEQRPSSLSAKRSRIGLNSEASVRLSYISRTHTSSESIATATYKPVVPTRTSSLLSRSDHSLQSIDSKLLQSGEAVPRAPKTRPSKRAPPRLQLHLEEWQNLQPSFLGQTGMDTPPLSDQDESNRYKAQTTQRRISKPLPQLPLNNITPDLSPKLTPVQDDEVSCSSEPEPQPLLRRDSTETTIRVPLPHIATALRQSVVSTKSRESSESMLTEPDFSDFLGLSDDDLAEAQPQTPEPLLRCSTPTDRGSGSVRSTLSPRRLRACAPPSTPPSVQAPEPPVSPNSLLGAPLKLLQSPFATSFASQAATAAAFEIARIASRHQFDLVYIVNLWPKRMACFQEASPWGIYSAAQQSSASPDSTPRQTLAFDVHNKALDNRGSYAHMTAKSPLRGRILAAYGLASVKKAPFRLSGSIHAKILNNDGWVECDEPDADAHQFARGYGCAFYTSHAPVTEPAAYDADADTEGDVSSAQKQKQQQSTASSSSGKRASRIRQQKQQQQQRKSQQELKNRGIAFVAYRRQRADGADLGCDRATLAALYRDAEALIEMILDFHTIQRRRQRLQEEQRKQKLSVSSTQSCRNPLDFLDDVSAGAEGP
ncbi:uncharacterized protein E0L32_004287 [Thyridium curvatum]|uniref:Uncharacterized protein n=1 Tax=Thyridium curvatum TaxID=1093900 RepID=A0A507BE83_9PEZI|nr:uncharacterized protein E0L32_004287 [Thyridium curvatum]TPX15589.1 hypothetical protein E0L32_004287 [Thyridium curvatum]